MTVLPARLAAALADRYRIERELGRGGMATVYLAQDLKHDRGASGRGSQMSDGGVRHGRRKQLNREDHMTRLASWTAGAALALMFSSGCDTLGIGGGDCTLIGCTDGITVHLPAVPPGAYKVEIVISGTGNGGPSYVYECAGGPGCQQDIFFPELVLEHIIVRVTTSLGSINTEIANPVYTTSRPNGRDCPPLCRQILVNAQLPG